MAEVDKTQETLTTYVLDLKSLTTSGHLVKLTKKVDKAVLYRGMRFFGPTKKELLHGRSNVRKGLAERARGSSVSQHQSTSLVATAATWPDTVHQTWRTSPVSKKQAFGVDRVANDQS